MFFEEKMGTRHFAIFQTICLKCIFLKLPDAVEKRYTENGHKTVYIKKLDFMLSLNFSLFVTKFKPFDGEFFTREI